MPELRRPTTGRLLGELGHSNWWIGGAGDAAMTHRRGRSALLNSEGTLELAALCARKAGAAGNLTSLDGVTQVAGALGTRPWPLLPHGLWRVGPRQIKRSDDVPGGPPRRLLLAQFSVKQPSASVARPADSDIGTAGVPILGAAARLRAQRLGGALFEARQPTRQEAAAGAPTSGAQPDYGVWGLWGRPRDCRAPVVAIVQAGATVGQAPEAMGCAPAPDAASGALGTRHTSMPVLRFSGHGSRDAATFVAMVAALPGGAEPLRTGALGQGAGDLAGFRPRLIARQLAPQKSRDRRRRPTGDGVWGSCVGFAGASADVLCQICGLGHRPAEAPGRLGAPCSCADDPGQSAVFRAAQPLDAPASAATVLRSINRVDRQVYLLLVALLRGNWAAPARADRP